MYFVTLCDAPIYKVHIKSKYFLYCLFFLVYNAIGENLQEAMKTFYDEIKNEVSDSFIILFAVR